MIRFWGIGCSVLAYLGKKNLNNKALISVPDVYLEQTGQCTQDCVSGVDRTKLKMHYLILFYALEFCL